jgi:hypothetical protein
MTISAPLSGRYPARKKVELRERREYRSDTETGVPFSQSDGQSLATNIWSLRENFLGGKDEREPAHEG